METRELGIRTEEKKGGRRNGRNEYVEKEKGSKKGGKKRK